MDYNLKGNSVILSVKPDNSVVYPIVVPLVDHPNRIKTSYMTKSQVLDVRNQFKSTTASSAFEYLVATILCFIKDTSLLGAAWGTIVFMNDTYNSKKFAIWDKIYTEFKKTYAKVDATWKWHQGHRSYYPTGHLKCTYASSKS